MKLFKNRLFINTISIYAGEGLCRLTTFIVALAVARRFSPPELGQYGYAVALASVFAVLPDMGLHLWATGEVAKDANSLSKVFWDLQGLKTVVAGFSGFLVVTVGTWFIHDPGRRGLFYVLAFRALLQTFSLANMAFFKGRERMHVIAYLQSANGLVTLAWLIACNAWGEGLFTTVSAMVAGQLVELVTGWLCIYSRHNPGKPHFSSSDKLLATVFTTIPIGLAAILQAFGIRVDILILGVYSSNEDLGRFQAASMMMVAGFLATSLLMTVLYPKLVRLMRNPSETGTSYLDSYLKHGVLLAGCASILVWIEAPEIVRVFFGPSFLPGARFLRILAPALPFVFVNTSMLYVFVANGRRFVYLTALASTIALGSALSFILVPAIGADGVAIADLVREGLGSLIYLQLLRRHALIRTMGSVFPRVVSGAAILSMGAFLLLRGMKPPELWAVIWSGTMLAGTVLFLGRPRRDQLVLLALEDL